jgi:hypothetical protein
MLRPTSRGRADERRAHKLNAARLRRKLDGGPGWAPARKSRRDEALNLRAGERFFLGECAVRRRIVLARQNPVCVNSEAPKDFDDDVDKQRGIDQSPFGRQHGAQLVVADPRRCGEPRDAEHWLPREEVAQPVCDSGDLRFVL